MEFVVKNKYAEIKEHEILKFTFTKEEIEERRRQIRDSHKAYLEEKCTQVRKYSLHKLACDLNDLVDKAKERLEVSKDDSLTLDQKVEKAKKLDNEIAELQSNELLSQVFQGNSDPISYLNKSSHVVDYIDNI